MEKEFSAFFIIFQLFCKNSISTGDILRGSECSAVTPKNHILRVDNSVPKSYNRIVLSGCSRHLSSFANASLLILVYQLPLAYTICFFKRTCFLALSCHWIHSLIHLHISYTTHNQPLRHFSNRLCVQSIRYREIAYNLFFKPMPFKLVLWNADRSRQCLDRLPSRLASWHIWMSF